MKPLRKASSRFYTFGWASDAEWQTYADAEVATETMVRVWRDVADETREMAGPWVRA